MTQNAAGHFSYYDSENNSEAYFFYDTIDASGYAIGMGFLRNDLVNDQKQTHQRYIRLTLTLSFIIVILLLLYFGRCQFKRLYLAEISPQPCRRC